MVLVSLYNQFIIYVQFYWDRTLIISSINGLRKVVYGQEANFCIIELMQTLEVKNWKIDLTNEEVYKLIDKINEAEYYYDEMKDQCFWPNKEKFIIIFLRHWASLLLIFFLINLSKLALFDRSYLGKYPLLLKMCVLFPKSVLPTWMLLSISSKKWVLQSLCNKLPSFNWIVDLNN